MAKFKLYQNRVLEQFKKVKEVTNIVSYSSKTNPLVTPILEENTNSIFSIHLKNELKNVKDKSRVLFLAQGLTYELLDELTNQEIDFFAIDNEPDLNILLNYIKENNKSIKLLLRMKLREHSIKTEKYFVFGLPTEFINRKISELKNNPNIKKIGVHFHRKTQNMSEWNYQYELESVLDKNTITALDYVNIGGGLPSVYANTNVDVVNSVLKKIDEIKSWLNKQNIKMIIEPGRFIAAPSVELETNIIRIYDNNIIVDASIYNSDMDAIIVPVKLKIKNELKQGEGEPFVIKGITPCSMDLFRYRVYLNTPKKGDKIIFINAGAYNFSSEFCDLDKIPTEVIK